MSIDDMSDQEVVDLFRRGLLSNPEAMSDERAERFDKLIAEHPEDGLSKEQLNEMREEMIRV